MNNVIESAVLDVWVRHVCAAYGRATYLLSGWTEADERACLTANEAACLLSDPHGPIAAKRLDVGCREVQFVDVRSERAWARSSVQGALHLPVRNAGLPRSVAAAGLKSSAIIVLFCVAGDRARRAAGRLRELGFVNVFFVWSGGFYNLRHALQGNRSL